VSVGHEDKGQRRDDAGSRRHRACTKCPTCAGRG